MEVNKDEAERCKVIGANAMKQKQYDRAAKFFKKSLSLFPLPGVEALLSTAERMASEASASDNDTSASNTTDNNNNNNNNFTRSTSTASSVSETPTSAGGRTYTTAQVEIVETILNAKATGGRTAHYKVLQLSSTNPTEAEIKKAYRKLAIKVHPDKNSAPKADEAFKAVGLAYATLSDPQKKAIYDQSGEEDPDNRGGGGGGGMRRHGGGMHFRPGDEVSPEDIFNMFFGGGMPGGGMGSMHRGPGGMHFYSNFGGMNGFARAQQQQQRRRQAHAQQQPPNDDAPPGLASLMQLLPFLLILALSFLNMNDGTGGVGGSGGTTSPGLDRYFSLTHKEPFVHPMHTKLTKVQEIPYFVDNKVMRAINRDRSQLIKIERMVETSYENYLVDQCNAQRRYKKKMLAEADAKSTPEEIQSAKASAEKIALSRCVELNELFPLRHSGRSR